MNVLIVDDNADDRRLLRYTLEHHGYSVIEARDGKEGLELATLNKPDIIVSDALMPRMDGFQFLRSLKTYPELSSIPFLFYSAVYTGEEEERLALSLGAVAFIPKPAEPEDIFKKISAVMSACGALPDTGMRRTMDESQEHFFREYGRIVASKLEEKVEELTREIAERRRVESALMEQERELSTIFENAPFMMMLLDRERRIRRVNGLACSFTGSSADDMIDRRSGEALHCIRALDTSEGCGSSPRCRDCVVRLTVLDTLETGQIHHMVEASLPLTVQEKELTIPFLISTAKVMVGDEPMVLLSLQDISEYKKLEAQLHHAQKMESIGTLAGGIAHDFNNILTVIIGYGQVALMEMSADAPHRQNIEQMLTAAERAAHLTRDLLLFSRKQISDKKIENLNEIVQSLEKFLRRVIGEDISCTITLADGAIPVFADAHQLEQVLMNFATNARDAMQNGGSLTISTERIRLDEAFITSHGYGSCGDYSVLTVTDTGHGMDAETIRQIFDPFFTTKEVGKGTGLGLSVVYGIVRQHDGYITVYSEPGLGTTFRIYLPLSLSLSPANERMADINPENSLYGTETILLAEDDETVRNIARLPLQNFGYNVITAVDGEDAVQKFRENIEDVRLLLFDVIMPRKNGKDASDEIRAIKPDVKVIFTSGYGTDSVHLKALSDDNVMLISKPYIPAKLLKMVRTALNG
ncbi:MAG: response regulator [Deltaproteobacteria bacterium]|nr:response regulator [Deltaproteobacteria bacterium]